MARRMTHRPYAVVDISHPPPEEVRDEEYVVAPGETVYTLHLTDDQIELLTEGVVPEAIAQRAFRMLEWKRRERRVTARKLKE